MRVTETGFRSEFGWPGTAFFVERQTTPGRGDFGHGFGVQLSAAWLVAGLGALALYVYTRIRKAELGGRLPFMEGGVFWVIWLVWGGVAVGLCLMPLIVSLMKTK